MRVTGSFHSFVAGSFGLIGLAIVPLAVRADLPQSPFPLGRADLAETRTVRELRPGLMHVHVERGTWPKEGPPKYAFLKPAKQPPSEFRACMEHAGYSVREHRFAWSEGEEPLPILIAGEFSVISSRLVVYYSFE